MYTGTFINIYYAYTNHGHFCCLKSIHNGYTWMVIITGTCNWGIDIYSHRCLNRWGEMGEYIEVYSFTSNHC